MENFPSFDGEKPQRPEQNLAGQIEAATTAKEIVEIINKAGGIKGSDDKIMTALELHKLIKQLLEVREQGMTLDSPVVNLGLNQITRKEGLRAKIEKLIFGEK